MSMHISLNTAHVDSDDVNIPIFVNFPPVISLFVFVL